MDASLGGYFHTRTNKHCDSKCGAHLSKSCRICWNLACRAAAPKPWLPPTLSFKTDFPKTAAAVNELKGSVKASVAAVDELKSSLKQSVEAIPIYRSIQSKARRARDKVFERRRPAPSPSRAPGLTSRDVATFVERELPSAKAKD